MKKETFIMRARKEQIMEAAVQTLDEIGFARASLAQIAKRADISTALISYHFSDKQDLMNHVLEQLIMQSAAAVLDQVFLLEDPLDQLEVFIRETLRYQRQFPARHIALIEIVFQAKNDEEVPYYRMDDGDPDPFVDALTDIIDRGQGAGVFRKYHKLTMIHLVQGAISEGIMASEELADAERYAKELTAMIMDAICEKD